MMNKFLNKVELERKALRLINSKLKEPKLNGLTLCSIDKWFYSFSERPIEYEILRELSISLSALNERSGEKFDGNHELNVCLSNNLISKIEKSLTKIY